MSFPGLGVSYHRSSSTHTETIHTPSRVTADHLYLNGGNAKISGTQIRARVIDAIIHNSLTLEEEGLRSIILQRKNSYFFKTPYSARVLSGLHSLVKTCEVNVINSFGYLNWLQEQGEKVILDPAAYLPFQYQKVAGTPGQGPPLQQAA